MCMKTNPFKLNFLSDVEEIPLPYYDRMYYQIDNFYKDPDAVLDYLEEECLYDLFKKGAANSLNGEKFSDKRHTGTHPGMWDVATVLKLVCKAQEFKNDPQQISTNTFQMHDRE